MNKIADKHKGELTFLFIYAKEAHPPSSTALPTGEEDLQAITPLKAVEIYRERQSAGRSLRRRLAGNWHVLIDSCGSEEARPSYMCGLDNPLFVIGGWPDCKAHGVDRCGRTGALSQGISEQSTFR